MRKNFILAPVTAVLLGVLAGPAFAAESAAPSAPIAPSAPATSVPKPQPLSSLPAPNKPAASASNRPSGAPTFSSSARPSGAGNPGSALQSPNRPSAPVSKNPTAKKSNAIAGLTQAANAAIAAFKVAKSEQISLLRARIESNCSFSDLNVPCTKLKECAVDPLSCSTDGMLPRDAKLQELAREKVRAAKAAADSAVAALKAAKAA